ncbi:MAG: tetratricopeptide repeat protein, partial [Chloroflexi bacterium]
AEHTPYLVLDYAPNGTLRDRYPLSARLPLPLIVTYIKQIAEALAFAHERLLVHRDIKPENLLLGRNGEALLSDFGIAIMADPSFTNPSQEIAGTLAYIAPEQLQGFPQPVSDQYSLGIVVYEWITGERLFTGQTFEELVYQQINVTPPSLRQKVAQLPPAVEQVVLKALAKDPQERYPTITDFARALELAVQNTSGLFSAPTILASFTQTSSDSLVEKQPIAMTLQKTKQDWLAAGNASCDEQAFADALCAYEQALVLDPNFVPALIGKAIALRNLNRHQEALSEYDRAIELDPSNAIAYNNKSLVLNELQRYSESLVFSQRALAIAANYPAAHFNMGYALGELKRYEEEIAAYQRAIALDPTFANAYNAKGVALNALKRHEEALSAFDKAIALAPNFAIAYGNKAYTLGLMQRYSEALMYYQRATELKPNYTNAYKGLINMLEALGRTKEAEEVRKKAF